MLPCNTSKMVKQNYINEVIQMVGMENQQPNLFKLVLLSLINFDRISSSEPIYEWIQELIIAHMTTARHNIEM